MSTALTILIWFVVNMIYHAIQIVLRTRVHPEIATLLPGLMDARLAGAGPGL